MDKKNIHLQLPIELYDKVKLESINNFMTVSAFIRNLIVQYFNDKDKTNDKTRAKI